MNKIIMTIVLALGALVCNAEEYRLGDIRILHPWARATLPGAQVGGVYLQLQNAGKADRLLSAKSDVAETIELHAMSVDGTVMQMRRLDKGVELPSRGAVEFKPGSLHIMLTGLHAPLKQGSTFPLQLKFERSGTTTVAVKVEALTAAGASMP
ncbi:MAG: hypothetical protein JWN23_458 [Rhodocyclales bacterium]|nr:hypothetical protein [Rhodocyclales bacterium]